MKRSIHPVRWASVVLAVGILASLLVSCANPVSSSSTTGATITGRVYNEITGAGVSGAKVAIGSASAIADGSGSYSIALGSGATSASGALVVTAGSSYDFLYEQNVKVTTTGGTATLNIPLPPASTVPTVVTVSGTAKFQDGTSLQSGAQVGLEVANQNGGSYQNSISLSTAGSYSLSLPDLGSNCFVVVTLVPSSSTTTESTETYYLKNVDLSTSTTLNLEPPSGGATDVTLTNSVGTSSTAETVGVLLDVPGYGLITDESSQFTTSSGSTTVYDPDGYRVELVGSVYSSSSGVVSVQGSISAPTALASSLALPALSETVPTNHPSLSTATYSNGEITFTPSTDAQLTEMGMSRSGGESGLLIVTGSPFTLPSSIQTLIGSATGWTTNVLGVNASADGIPLLDALGGGSPQPGALQVGYSGDSTSGTKSGFPQ